MVLMRADDAYSVRLHAGTLPTPPQRDCANASCFGCASASCFGFCLTPTVAAGVALAILVVAVGHLLLPTLPSYLGGRS